MQYFSVLNGRGVHLRSEVVLYPISAPFAAPNFIFQSIRLPFPCAGRRGVAGAAGKDRKETAVVVSATTRASKAK